jgi:hypothetical protein
VVDFLDSKAKVEASSQGLLATKRFSSDSSYSQNFPRQMTGLFRLYLAAHFRVQEAMNALREKGVKADSKDERGQTPLS